MTIAPDIVQVRFEGYSVGTEIWGSTQANFLVKLPGRNAREAAVLLNDPTATLLAGATGHDDTPEFRERAARIAGELALRDAVERRGEFDSVTLLSKAYLEQRPGLFGQIQAALA